MNIQEIVNKIKDAESVLLGGQDYELYQWAEGTIKDALDKAEYLGVIAQVRKELADYGY